MRPSRRRLVFLLRRRRLGRLRRRIINVAAAILRFGLGLEFSSAHCDDDFIYRLPSLESRARKKRTNLVSKDGTRMQHTFPAAAAAAS